MNIEHLVLDIRYDITQDEFVINGRKNSGEKRGFLKFFIGKRNKTEEDRREVEERDIYNIIIKWNPYHKKFKTYANTGNDDFTRRILMHYVEKTTIS